MVVSSWAALRALAEVAPGSHWPAWAVESSSDSYLIVNFPILPPRCFSASFMPRTTSSDCLRPGPWNGRLE